LPYAGVPENHAKAYGNATLSEARTVANQTQPSKLASTEAGARSKLHSDEALTRGVAGPEERDHVVETPGIALRTKNMSDIREDHDSLGGDDRQNTPEMAPPRQLYEYEKPEVVGPIRSIRRHKHADSSV